MLWRSISAVIVLFWAVMTGLIIRDAYFPDSSRFNEVPPRLVFQLFLMQANSFNNQLQIYHDREKLGFAQFSATRLTEGNGAEGKLEEKPQGPVVYEVRANGSVTAARDGAPGLTTSFIVRAELENGDQWRSVQIQTKASAIGLSGVLTWKRGDEFPEIEVKQGDELIVNSDIFKSGMMQTMTALNGGMPGGLGGGQLQLLTQLKATGAAGGGGSFVDLKAREGVMELAGKARRCHILSATLVGMYEVKFFFTEVGELARIEMPGGYRLVEPLMHGLEPGMNTLQ